jgi:hypothetical protein
MSAKWGTNGKSDNAARCRDHSDRLYLARKFVDEFVGRHVTSSAARIFRNDLMPQCTATFGWLRWASATTDSRAGFELGQKWSL